MLAPNDRLRRTLRAGLVYRPYFGVASAKFDTSAADASLEPAGAMPAVPDYIDTIVAAALESDFGSR